MSLSTLSLRNFRNIESAELGLSTQCNIIIGDNGAGKTNILESIHYLSLARSFRTSQAKKIIQSQRDYLQVVGHIQNSAMGRGSTLGIRKSIAEIQIRINGESIKQSSQLAAYLPVQIIHPQGHQLLEQGPKQRRQFLDWGVFHVEPSFLPLWHDYSRTLKQRNAALRQGQAPRAIQLWDPRLVELGEKMTGLRTMYLHKLQPHINQYCSNLLGLEVDADFRPGWTNELDFKQALEKGLVLDRAQGFTRMGPHRADIVFKCENNRVQDYFSRGQQKLLVCALRLAQIKLLNDEKARNAVLLIDDLVAELDEQRRAKLFTAALETGAQVFITSTHLDLLKFVTESDCKVFHVEHGHVTEMVHSDPQMEINA